MRKMCLIPARGGSRRIPKKNIREFEGFPAIGSTIKTVKSTRLFDDIFVSMTIKRLLKYQKPMVPLFHGCVHLR